MAEHTPDTQQTSTDTASAADVLTLHHAVLSRWDGGKALGASHSTATVALSQGHDRWLGQLAGLSTLGGGFGPAAWNLAAQLVAEPTLLSRMGADLRTLQVGELADLVQLVLEEEEGQGEVQALTASIAAESARQRAGATGSAVKGKAGAAKTAPAKAATAKASARRAPPHLQHNLKELRRVLADLRRSEMGGAAGTGAELTGAESTGASMPQVAGDVGSDSPLQSIGSAAAPATAAAVGQGNRAPLQRLAAAVRNPGKSQSKWASPWQSVGDAHVAASAPKALRMAEQAADLALLDLAQADVGSTDSAATRQANSAENAAATGNVRSVAAGNAQADRSGGSLPRAGSVQASSGQVNVPAASSAAARRPVAAQAQAFAELRQQWMSQQTAAQLTATRQKLAQQTASHQTVARLASAQQALSQQALSQQADGRQAAQSLAGPGQSLASAASGLLRSNDAGAVDAGLAGASNRAAQAQVAPQFSGMASAVSYARSHLQRLERGIAKLATRRSVSSGATTASNPASAASIGVAGAVSSPLAAGMAAAQPGDFAAVQARSGGVLPRWQAWSDQTSAAFRGTAASRPYRGALAQGGEDRESLALMQEFAAAAEAVGAGNAQGAGSARAGAAVQGAGSVAGLGSAGPGRPSAGASARAVQSAALAADAAVRGSLAQAARMASSSQLPSWIAPQASRSAAQVGVAEAAAGQRVASQAVGAGAGRLMGDVGASLWARAAGGVPGLSAAAVAGLADRFVQRSMLGQEPGQADGLAQMFAPAGGAVVAQGQGLAQRIGLDAGLKLGADGSLGADQRFELGSGARLAAGRSAPFGREAPGEWLVAGEESDSSQSVQGAGAQSGGVQNGGVQNGTAQRPLAQGNGVQGRGAQDRAAQALGVQVIAAPAFGRAGQRSGVTAAAAGAAVAAIERAQRQAVAAIRTASAGSGRGPSLLQSLTGLGELGVLAAAPGGRPDALTPWLAKRLVPQQNLTSQGGEGAGEFLNLGEADGAEAAVSAAPGQAPGRATRRAVQGTSAGTVKTASASTAGRNRAGGLADLRAAAGTKSASAAVDSLTPQALRTILQALGESTVPAERDVASAFTAKWLGRTDVAGKVLQRMAADATPAGELLAMRDGASDAQPQAAIARSAGRAMPIGLNREAAAPVSAVVQGDSVVLSGFAALAALASGDFGQRPAPRQMAGQDVERTMLAPAADRSGDGLGAAAGPSANTAQAASASASKAAPSKSVGGVSAAAAPRKLAAVKLHEFSPLGLRRGRNLLGQQRRAGSWLHTTQRGQQAAARSLARLAGSRVGYGAAALGGGDLLGLGQADSEMYFGDGAPSPSAVRGADRLSQAVFARRSQGRHGAPAAQQAAMPAFDGMPVMPTDFRAGDNPAAAMQAAVAASGRSGGATAAIKSTQAAAMTRVLSVTAAPSANVLPLVAPAAQALVSAAAAKPLSESIVTSGADPTVGMPISGVGGHKAGKGGGGGEKERAAAEEHGSNVQDLEALAMKVARSVMVRIKRERERRGLHV